MSDRSEILAQRVAQAHKEFLDLCQALDDDAWRTPLPGDGRSIGVVVHHVAANLSIERSLIDRLAAGHPIEGLTRARLDENNAQHAQDHPDPTKEEALDLMEENSREVLSTISSLSDAELDRASTVSLHSNAPVTTQYFIEEHPLRHCFEHAMGIRAAAGLADPS